MDEISTEQISGYANTGMTMIMTYVPQLLLAIVVLIVGMWIINRFVAGTRKTLELRSFDPQPPRSSRYWPPLA